MISIHDNPLEINFFTEITIFATKDIPPIHVLMAYW